MGLKKLPKVLESRIEESLNDFLQFNSPKNFKDFCYSVGLLNRQGYDVGYYQQLAYNLNEGGVENKTR